MDTYTAFGGHTRITTGPLAKVALVLKHAAPTDAPVMIFSDRTGQPIDLDLRGSDREILARLPSEMHSDWLPMKWWLTSRVRTIHGCSKRWASRRMPGMNFKWM